MEIVSPELGSTSTGFNNSLKATEKLKVAKWEKAFEGSSGSPTVKSDFNERDVDRFGTLKLTTWRVSSTFTRSVGQIDEAVVIMREILAQIGLDVDHTPKSVNFSDFTFAAGDGKISLFVRNPISPVPGEDYDFILDYEAEGKAFMEQFSTPGEIDVYFLSDIINYPKLIIGFANTSEGVASLPEATDPIDYQLKYTDKAFVLDGIIINETLGFGTFVGTEYTLAHEFVHLPGNAPHHPSGRNLMAVPDAGTQVWEDKPIDRRRLDQDQEDRVYELSRTYIILEP